MRILMVGGGVCGSGRGLLLARDGHDVVVLERDADALPDTPPNAWESWIAPASHSSGNRTT